MLFIFKKPNIFVRQKMIYLGEVSFTTGKE